MKETILHTPKNIAFLKEMVKHLPQAIRNGLPGEIAVVPVSAAESRLLNRRYRRKNKAANVLSFLYPDTILSSSGLTRGSRVKMLDSRVRGNDRWDRGKDRLYGEIIVCPSLIRVEAKAQQHTFEYQMTWMIAHGMIHLSGLHHEVSAADSKKSEALEKKILQNLFQKSGSQHHRIA